MSYKSTFLVFVLVGMIAVSLLPQSARAAPVITDLNHTWKYPQTGEMLNITAKVVDTVSLTIIQLFYCSIPGGVCQFFDMDGPDASDVYNKTVGLHPLSTGADYYVVAVNANSESTTSETKYIHYAFAINATLTSDKTHVYPGEHFNLTVGAIYDDNGSAMAEYSDVLIERLGSAEQYTGVTNETGNFTVEIDAPATVETYTYRVTVTNRSLSGQAEVDIVVQVEDLPDIVVEVEDIIISNNQPTEGDTVTANVTVENWGTLDATFYVLITLGSGGTTQTLTNVSVTLSVGEDEHIQVSWTALRGVQYINVTADPGNFVRENSETNNFASVQVTGTYIPPPDEDIPFSLYAGIAIVIIVVLAGIAILLRRRKSAPPELQ